MTAPLTAPGEAQRLAAELSEARVRRPALLVRPAPRAAVLHSSEDAWAIEVEAHQRGPTHRTLLLAASTALRRHGVETDVVSPDDPLGRYELVAAPALHLCTAERVAALRTAAEAGTIVVIGPRSLVKDLDSCWMAEPAPAGLTGALGARVAEGLSPTERVLVRFGRGESPAVVGGPWTDVLELLDDEEGRPPVVLARYLGGFLDGAPAAVRRGNLVLAGFSSPDAWTALLAVLLGSEASVPDGQERFERGGRPVELDHNRLRINGVPRPGGAGAEPR